METGLTRNQIISSLVRSPHGKLSDYLGDTVAAAMQHPDFVSHLIAWNARKGQIRDSKAALPIASLVAQQLEGELAENSLAHFGSLGWRELLRAYRFALDVRPAGRMRSIRSVVELKIRALESSAQKWDRVAVLHRHTLRELYALLHLKPSSRANAVLFKNEKPTGSVFASVAMLRNMSPAEAAAEIEKRKIPFLVAKGALGPRFSDPDVLMALIGTMSPTTLVTNAKMLERAGVKQNPALRAAFQEAIKKASSSSANALKTSVAVDQLEDEEMKENLRGLQEKQLKSMGPEGNWLVLADKSGSMESAIEAAREVAGVLARTVQGKVWLVFFDTSPMTVDVTGLPLDAIKKATQHIRAIGGTSIGCGLLRMLDEKVEVDGIAIVSDGCENNPPYFADVYRKYAKAFDKEPTVYHYACGQYSTRYENNLKRTCDAAGIDLQVLQLANSADYYSIPNLVATMRSNRYSLIDEIMSTPLLKLEDLFQSARKEEVIHA